MVDWNPVVWQWFDNESSQWVEPGGRASVLVLWALVYLLLRSNNFSSVAAAMSPLRDARARTVLTFFLLVSRRSSCSRSISLMISSVLLFPSVLAAWVPTILFLFLAVVLDRFGLIFRFLLWGFFLVVVWNCFKWALTSFNDMTVVGGGVNKVAVLVLVCY